MATDNVEFLSTFPALPATAPVEHAHIVEYGKPGKSKALIQDAIVTLLYHISPETLTSFLDSKVKHFMLFQKCKQPEGVNGFVIIKKGNDIVAGEVAVFADQFLIEFDNLARMTIKEDQSWEIKYVSYRDYFLNDWDNVWEDIKVTMGGTLGSLTTRVTNDNDPSKDALKGFIAEGIFQHPPWNPEFFDSTVTITTADG